MALIFRLKDANFTNFVNVIVPPAEGLVARFTFGVNAESSAVNRVPGGPDGTWVGATDGHEFGSNFATINQRTGRYFRILNVENADLTIISAVRSSSAPRLYAHAGFGFAKQLVATSGTLTTQYDETDGTNRQLLIPGIGTTPSKFVTSARYVATGSATTMKADFFDSVIGSTRSAELSAGPLNVNTAGADIGREAAGFVSLHETLLYDRALSDEEVSLAFEYLSRKYF